jgi:TetR/AcrR family transcriptional regulator, transcriptional repressor for nem operon
MRYGDDHKDTVREKLVRNASRLVRKKGISGTSVAKVMGSAGMTVGGFYRHFDSQDDLLGEALALALSDARGRLFDGLDHLRGRAFEQAFAQRYLSEHHRDDVVHGCPMPSTASELGRAKPKVRAPIAAEAASILEYMGERIGSRSRAIALIAACVGGVALSRALGGVLGDEILRETRDSQGK